MRPASTWLLGFAVGVAGTLIALYVPLTGLFVYALMVVALLHTRQLAPFGGASLATGVWFATAAAFLLCGVALSVYSLGNRSVRGGA